MRSAARLHPHLKSRNTSACVVSTSHAGVKPVTDVVGSTFAVPVTFSGIGAAYAMGALEAIDGTPPRTWTDLLTLCDTARAHGKVLFAVCNATPRVR